MTLYVIDAVAALFVLAGFHLAFRQRLLRAWARRLRRGGPDSPAPATSGDPEGVASVLRMAGVMIMALSLTICAFANLMAWYGAASPAS